jgi:hypothetical protein
MRVRARSLFVLERLVVGASVRGRWAGVQLAWVEVSDPDVDDRRATPLITKESNGDEDDQQRQA